MVRKLGAAAAVAVLLAVSGCGGSDVERPSQEDVVKGLSPGGKDLLGINSQPVNEEGIDCAAKALVDSDLSNEALKAVIEGDEDFEGSNDDAKALTAVTGKVTECATSNLEIE